MLKTSLFVALWGLGSIAAATAWADTAPATEATKATIQRVCQQCHDLSVLTQAPHSPQEWRAIVARMRANGADLSDAEVKDVADYLARAYAPQS